MKTAEQVSAQKLRGGFYTPPALVRHCLDRAAALAGGGQALTVLEPSAGDGAFVRGLAGHRMSARVARMTAIELVPQEAAKCLAEAPNVPFDLGVVTGSSLAREHWAGRGYDVAIGNPPFVRFQFVGPAETRAADALARDLGVAFTGVSNLWLPVFLASLRALRDGGAFAFVLPAELFTGVSANVARRWLAGQAGRLRVDLFGVGSFPGVMQEVVVLSGISLAAPRAGRGRLLLHEHGRGGQARCWAHPIDPGARTWTPYLLGPGQLDALREAAGLGAVRRVGDLARFEVATVTGANEFFTVDAATLGRYRLGPWALPLLPRARHAAGLRFTAADYACLRDGGARAHLLSFAADRPEPGGGALDYLRRGERDGLAERFKCRIRTPWYRVPVVPTGHIMLAKRSHRYPRLILNCAGAYTTDTVYRGRLLPATGLDAADLVTAFHNTLTLLTAEIEGRSFGGGVLELVPTEVGRLLVPAPAGFGAELARLDSIARSAPAAGESLVAETDRLLSKQVDGLSALLDRLQEARQLLLARRLARNSAR